MKSALAHADNVKFQAENHGLVDEGTADAFGYCKALIHRKPYEYAQTLSRSKNVLDLGCNKGYGSFMMSQPATKVVGVDVSEMAIAEARRRYVQENLEFYVVDGRTLPFGDGVFDVVTSFQVIEHVIDVDGYLSEIGRVLTAEGTAIFTTPNREIRLDPDMEPWNRLHVCEYRADELSYVLRRWFADVQVYGLFAVPDFYDIEFERVQRSLRAARSRRGWRMLLRRSLIDAFKACVPERVLRDLRRLGGRDDRGGNGRPMLVQRTAFTSADLYYSQDDLARALDLMAVCRGESVAGRGRISRSRSNEKLRAGQGTAGVRPEKADVEHGMKHSSGKKEGRTASVLLRLGGVTRIQVELAAGVSKAWLCGRYRSFSR